MRRSQRLAKPQAPVSDAHLSDSSLSDLPESDEDSGFASSKLMTLSDDDDELLSSDHAVSDHSSNDETFSPSRSKKRKKSQRKKKSKAQQTQSSRPAGLVNLPAEVLLIVLAQTDIETMYNLSFVNKHLHNLVSGDLCDSTWEDLLAAEHMPEVDMPALKLAHLLFSKYCFQCGRKCTIKPEGGIQTRICKRCQRQHVLYRSQALEAFSDEDPVHPALESALMGYRFLRSDIRAINDFLFEWFPVPSESLGTWNEVAGDWNYSAAPTVSFRKIDQHVGALPVFGPKIELYHWIEHECAKQSHRQSLGFQLERWFTDRKKKKLQELIAWELERLEDVRERLEDYGWTSADFVNWKRWTVPNSVFKAPCMDEQEFKAILGDLEAWVAPYREARASVELELEAMEAEINEEQDRQSKRQRLGEKLKKLHQRIESTTGDDDAILPFAAFALLPAVQRLFEDPVIEEESKEFDEIEKEATQEAIEAARKCDKQLIKSLKSAVCAVLSNAPHLDFADLVRPGPPLEQVPLEEVADRINLAASAISFVTETTWYADWDEPGAAHGCSTWMMDSLEPGLKQFYSSALVNAFDNLDVFRKGFGMQTATDWACSEDRALVAIQPRHQIVRLLVIKALKREGIAPHQWSSAIRDNDASWYCRTCGHVSSVNMHIVSHHLYRNGCSRITNEVDDFDVWQVEKPPALMYLPPPTRSF